MTTLNVNVDSRTPVGSLMSLPFRRWEGNTRCILVNECPDSQKTHGKYLPNYSPPRIVLNLRRADCEMVWNALVSTGQPDVIIYGENSWPAMAVNSYTVEGQTIVMEAPMALPVDRGIAGTQASAI